LLIAHDLDGLDPVDQVVVLSHGRVTECGTYAQLIQVHGSYLRI
jgi:ABC-type transport system involved in Fe-S cluster assembly fused permease/ATPase subunit